MYTGGASTAALKLAAQHADVFLAWVLRLEQMRGLVDRAREQFAAAGRLPRLGLRSHIVLGETEPEAWANAEELLSRADPRVEAQRRRSGPVAMTGRAAQVQAAPDYRLSERLWNGISRVRVNLGTAIVGTPSQVAGELASYWRLGFDEFILSGYPHPEEAPRVAREVLPRLREAIARDVTMGSSVP
jgi:alkanesulfonate monooxygenase